MNYAEWFNNLQAHPCTGLKLIMDYCLLVTITLCTQLQLNVKPHVWTNLNVAAIARDHWRFLTVVALCYSPLFGLNAVDVSMQKKWGRPLYNFSYESPNKLLLYDCLQDPSDKCLWFDNLTLQQAASTRLPAPLQDWILLPPRMLVIVWHQCLVNSSSHAWQCTHKLSLCHTHRNTHQHKGIPCPVKAHWPTIEMLFLNVSLCVLFCWQVRWT